MPVQTTNTRKKLQQRAAAQAAAPGDTAPATRNDHASLVRGWLESMKGEIQRALPKHMTADRLARVALTTIRQNPQLLSCTKESLLGALMLCAQLGLEPGPLGHAWLVPFGNSRTGTMECQFILGYRGFIDLAWRSGQLVSLAVHEVCEHDEFEFEYGLEEKLRHKPAIKDRGKVVGYYLVARYKDGGHFTYFMSIQDVEKHRKRSRAADSGPWVTDYDAMARKTVVREAARWMPLSVEIQRALAQDESVKAEIDVDMTDVPNVVDTTGEAVDAPEAEESVAPAAAEETPAGEAETAAQKRLL